MVEGTRANLTDWDPQKDLILRVCASNAIGDGPWSQPLVVSSHDHAGKACRAGVGCKALRDYTD
jgi:TYRO3 protein tyrosine kinase 3